MRQYKECDDVTSNDKITAAPGQTDDCVDNQVCRERDLGRIEVFWCVSDGMLLLLFSNKFHWLRNYFSRSHTFSLSQPSPTHRYRRKGFRWQVSPLSRNPFTWKRLLEGLKVVSPETRNTSNSEDFFFLWEWQFVSVWKKQIKFTGCNIFLLETRLLVVQTKTIENSWKQEKIKMWHQG